MTLVVSMSCSVTLLDLYWALNLDVGDSNFLVIIFVLDLEMISVAFSDSKVKVVTGLLHATTFTV